MARIKFKIQINTLCNTRRAHDGECAVWIEDMFGKIIVYSVVSVTGSKIGNCKGQAYKTLIRKRKGKDNLVKHDVDGRI
jgi:hypothetical protein